MTAREIATATTISIVLPQVVGYAATRLARRRAMIVWSLAAAGTVAVVITIVFFQHHREISSLGQGYSQPASQVLALALAIYGVPHLAVGALLGWRYRRRHSVESG